MAQIFVQLLFIFNIYGIFNDWFCVAQAKDPLCGLVASTNIESLYSEWSCGTDGQPVTNPCDPLWHGLNCSFVESTSGNVFNISLDSIGLNGTISPLLSELTSLQYLYMNDNELTYSIPSNIGTLENLLVLDLNRNNFSGVIPSDIGSLSILSVLSLRRCGLFGTLPSSMMDMTNLLVLNMEGNRISGSIGTYLWSLVKLNSLVLDNNMLSGELAPSIAQLLSLERLSLDFNNITGSVPSTLCAMSKLTHLSISENAISGTLPTNIGNLVSLTRLSLYGNMLKGTIPTGVGSLSSLFHLALNANHLNGSIPFEIGNLSVLKALHLQINSLTSSIPSTISSLNALTILDMGYNMFRYSLPIGLFDMINLRFFDVSNSLLTGTMPYSLGNMTQLSYFHVGTNRLVGSIPNTIGNLTKLKHLNIGYNSLTGTIPTELGYISKMHSLSLNNNFLTGGIPSSICSMSYMTHLYMGLNPLGGSLPSGLGNMKRLFKLDVNTAMLTGTIPSVLGTLTDMQHLFLYANQLTGTIPPELSQISVLRYLYLHTNQLTGSIPSTIGQFKVLGYLFFENNLLNGTIPDTMSDIRLLEYITLNNNKLSGSIGSTFSHFSLLTKLDISSNRLTGSLPTHISNSVGYVNVAWNSLQGTIPGQLSVLTTMEYFNISANSISGSIPTELCASTSIKLDVSDTGIACYSGCLTSSEVLIVGASNDCHDGSLMRLFMIVMGSFCVVILSATVYYRVVYLGNESIDNNMAVCGDIVKQRPKELEIDNDNVSSETGGLHKQELGNAKGLSVSSPSISKSSNLYEHDWTMIGVSALKLGIALAIALFLTEWWIYNSSSTTVVESCSNNVVGDCKAFCGDVSIVQVNITDDDYFVDSTAIGSSATVVTTSHVTETEYCIAELPGSCAKKFWMVFKFVPLMLHVFQFVLQCLFFYLIKEFNPQQRQYDVIIKHLYPNIASCNEGFDDFWFLPSGSSISNFSMQNDSGRAGLGRVSDRIHLRARMLRTLQEAPLFSVFAFIEMFTVLYVWGELQFPAVYCGQVRPLSLYYYPMAMSWLDLIKLNLYVCARHFQNEQYRNGILSLLNFELFVTNSWITFVLAITYCYYLCAYLSSLPWVLFNALKQSMNSKSDLSSATASDEHWNGSKSSATNLQSSISTDAHNPMRQSHARNHSVDTNMSMSARNTELTEFNWKEEDGK